MSRTPLLALLLTTFLVAQAGAGDAPERYLFYLHGQIVEGSDGRPEHPSFGIYDYPAIIEAFEAEGFTVMSEIRESRTDGNEYAERVATEVRLLLAEGVAPAQISIVGASKGGAIAMVLSSILADEGLNFVFMGTCLNWIRGWRELELRGRVLLISEESDTVAGSCTEAFADREILPEFHEILIDTGRDHGAFFTPDPQWLEPTVNWCRGESP